MKIETTLEDMRESSDWQQVFGFAKSFVFDDVTEVLASSNGENDERPWKAIVSLKNGNFGFIEAGCDYSGWDCQASGQSFEAPTLQFLIRFVMSEDDRSQLEVCFDASCESCKTGEPCH